ncbi:MAG: acyl carrier protein [Desulfobacteraceae bacterium]|nr:acyl carrier protein [Desulfobacteraceae bacterium]MBC2718110.1 acyl carrier protein [Desulfobacteraceae bacterium]
MTTKEDIIEMIKDLDINVDILSLSASTPLREQGLDSLDMATIFFELDDRYSIKVTDEDIENGKLESIDKIFNFINGNP